MRTLWLTVTSCHELRAYRTESLLCVDRRHGTALSRYHLVVSALWRCLPAGCVRRSCWADSALLSVQPVHANGLCRKHWYRICQAWYVCTLYVRCAVTWLTLSLCVRMLLYWSCDLLRVHYWCRACYATCLLHVCYTKAAVSCPKCVRETLWLRVHYWCRACCATCLLRVCHTKAARSVCMNSVVRLLRAHPLAPCLPRVSWNEACIPISAALVCMILAAVRFAMNCAAGT